MVLLCAAASHCVHRILWFYFIAVWINWCPLDTALGAWLLDPDHVPNTFSELLARYGLQQLAPPPAPGTRGSQEVCNVSTLQHDLALLGPLMVKLYQELQVNHLVTNMGLDILLIFVE